MADEFLDLCSRKKTLMSPIFVLQARAREKVGVGCSRCSRRWTDIASTDWQLQVLCASFWSKETKRRPALLVGHNDIFALLQSTTRLMKDTTAKNAEADKAIEASSLDRDAKLPVHEAKASVRLAAKQKLQERRELEKWIDEHRQQPPIRDYFAAFSDKFVTSVRLERLLSESTPGEKDAKEITELRYSSAVCAKSTSLATRTS